MSGPRFQKEREPASLKEAIAELINRCGGIEGAAKKTRVSRSQIARYSDPAHDDVHMPVDVVRALELACGEPIVTRYLASELGALLIPLHPKPDAPHYSEHLAQLGREGGKLYGEAAEMLGRGKTPKKAALVLREAMKTATALAELISDLRLVTR